MPAPHPVEFRLRAVQLARTGDKPVAVLAKELGISESCLRNWMAQADADEAGGGPGRLTSTEKKELAEYKLDQIGLPFELSETPGRIQGPPLVVGQHSREILAELGYSTQLIDELCAECVLAWSPAEGHRKIRSRWEPPAQ